VPTETIQITTTGANPQTKTVSVNVDPTTGSGSTSFTFTGVNSGQDTLVATATIASTLYTSNSAFVAWQPTNGTVSLASNVTIAGYANPGENPTWHGVGAAFPPILTGKNTVVINQVYTNGAVGNGVPITGLTTDDGNSGQYKHVPPLLDDVKSDGTALTSLGSVLGWGQGAQGDGSFVTFLQGQIVVAQSGIETFYFLVDDSWALYIGGGASYVSGAFTTGSPVSPSTASAATTGTSLAGVGPWPLLGTRNTAAVEVQPTDYVYVNFPAPGIYPFLAWFVNNADSQTFFQWTYAAGASAIPPASGNGESGGVIKPVALQPAPPATTPAGNLQLSLAQPNTQIQGNQMTLNVNVSGIVYPNKQYIPLLEGTTGKLFIYNDPTHVFNFQTYNGQPVDKPTAATTVFKLSGNTQSLLNVVYNDASDGQFSLKYSGTPFPAGIAASTQLTVTAEDIAWFDSVNKNYDTFAPASPGGPGGISFGVEVDYMVNPSGYTVSPTSVPADGNQHVFTVTLTEPMSPQQIGAGGKTNNNVTASFTSNGGTTIATGSIAQQLNTSGFLTGYTVPITVPVSETNGSFNLTMSLTGFLDYLNGTAFTIHGPVTYFSNQSKTVSTTGLGFSPPVAYSFSTNPNTTSLTTGSNVTLTGTAYTFDNNPMTMNFYYKNTISGSPAVLIGAGTRLSGPTAGTVSGQTVYFSTFTKTFVPPDQPGGNTDLLGFSATDTVSGLSTTYFSATTYTFQTVTTYSATPVQVAKGAVANGTSSTLTVSFPRPIAVGDTIILGVTEFDYSQSGQTINDNLGNTYTLVTRATNSITWNTDFYYANVTTGGSCTITMTFPGISFNSVIAAVAAEMAGLLSPAVVDASASTSFSGGQSSISSGTISTSNANDVIFSNMGIETSVPSTPAGFILIGVEASAEDGIGDALAYQVVSATGSYSPVWSGSVDVAGNTVAFRLKGVVS
jgi:hypothetical protein